MPFDLGLIASSLAIVIAKSIYRRKLVTSLSSVYFETCISVLRSVFCNNYLCSMGIQIRGSTEAKLSCVNFQRTERHYDSARKRSNFRQVSGVSCVCVCVCVCVYVCVCARATHACCLLVLCICQFYLYRLVWFSVAEHHVRVLKEVYEWNRTTPGIDLLGKLFVLSH